MKTLKSLEAMAVRSDGKWAITTPSIKNLFTEATHANEIDAMVRDAARLLGYNVGIVNVCYR